MSTIGSEGRNLLLNGSEIAELTIAVLDAVTAITNGAKALCGEGDRKCPVQVAADGNQLYGMSVVLGRHQRQDSAHN